jgi:hypothetical protein
LQRDQQQQACHENELNKVFHHLSSLKNKGAARCLEQRLRNTRYFRYDSNSERVIYPMVYYPALLYAERLL